MIRDGGDVSRRGVLLGSMGAAAFGALSWPVGARPLAPSPVRPLALLPERRPRNILVVLTDDHRFDALGFLSKHSFVQTPALDRLAAEGVHFRNACVTTALCSPSRASILTGLYAHQHRVVDNHKPVAADLAFFPQYLQRAGYDTALIGKWHMGDGDDRPQRGFDHWVSFKGQGSYMPDRNGLNVNGRRVPQRGYITDELTEYALDWLKARDAKKPWMLYLSHKAAHAPFVPAARHFGRYANETFVPPATMALGASGRPAWVARQRKSYHGVDRAYGGRRGALGEFYKRYMETLLGVDESLAAIMAALDRRGELDDTLIVYLGDNGFSFGEHGLIDKRTAYETSMRIPMLMRCPAMFPGGVTRDQIVANIDIAPTMLAAAGLAAPAHMAGANMLDLLRPGLDIAWRKDILYEYYWEWNYPQTPTLHALRDDRYKFVRAHGVVDVDELYDLATDPGESDNLFVKPGHEAIAEKMRARLYALIEGPQGALASLNVGSNGRIGRLGR